MKETDRKMYECLKKAIDCKTPVKAIRDYCLGCCCNSRTDVRKCTAINCALFHYRMGRRPTKAELLEFMKKQQLAKGFQDDSVDMCSLLSEDTGNQEMPS